MKEHTISPTSGGTSVSIAHKCTRLVTRTTDARSRGSRAPRRPRCAPRRVRHHIHDAQFVVLGKNAHTEEPSKEQAAKERKIKEHELEQSSRPAGGVARAVGPALSLQSVNRHKAYERSKTRCGPCDARTPKRSWGISWRASRFRTGRHRQRPTAWTTTWGGVVHPFHVRVQRPTERGLAGRGQHLRVVVDSTHGVCVQKCKLGVFAVLGERFDAGAWHNAVLPSMFLLSKREPAEGYSRLAKATEKDGRGGRWSTAQTPTRCCWGERRAPLQTGLLAFRC